MNCIFCDIIAGKIPATIIYQDELVVAIDDIQPQAPVHKLIIPKQHIATLNDLSPHDTLLAGHLLQTAQQLAKDLQIAKPGYRVIMNCNADGGQLVYHIHLHLLGGSPLLKLLG